MQRWAKQTTVISLILLITFSAFISGIAKAAASCSAVVSPGDVALGQNRNFDIAITNTGSSSIDWIDVTVPNDNFSYTGNSINNWSTADHDGGTTAYGNTIAAGQTASFTVSAVANNIDNADWRIRADDANGSSAVSCSGTLGLNVFAEPSQINISNTYVSEIGSREATITWETDINSSSQVFYSQGYDFSLSSSYDDSQVTIHTVTLVNLEPNSDYNFYVASTTPDGGYAASGQNTFLTAVENNEPPDDNNSNNGDNNKILGGGIPILSKPVEKIPPTVGLIDPGRVFKIAPKISGTADDNTALARIQYSTDGGKNWLPVDQSNGLGTKHASFSFTPILPKDGSYMVNVRAIDTSGNIGLGGQIKIVIAKVSPSIGGNLISLKSQPLVTDANGVITSVAGIDQKITLSTVGGPEIVYIEATDNSNKAIHSFSLTKSDDTNLWSGTIAFKKAGVYKLVAYAINGAGLKASRQINDVKVLQPTQVSDAKTNKLLKAKITVYYYEPNSQKWTLWDGAPYGQSNPINTGKPNSTSYFLPSGKYYLEVESSGYQKLVSRIFEINKPSPITANISLNHLKILNLGLFKITIPTVAAKYVVLNPGTNGNNTVAKNVLVDNMLPNFSLQKIDGTTIHTADLLGKPTLIVIGATWSPYINQQMAVIEKIQKNTNINIIAIASQEDLSKVKAYNAISALTINWAADPYGQTDNTLAANNMPYHYFVNRKGLVKQVYSGVLSEQQILNRLGGI